MKHCIQRNLRVWVPWVAIFGSEKSCFSSTLKPKVFAVCCGLLGFRIWGLRIVCLLEIGIALEIQGVD